MQLPWIPSRELVHRARIPRDPFWLRKKERRRGKGGGGKKKITNISSFGSIRKVPSVPSHDILPRPDGKKGGEERGERGDARRGAGGRYAPAFKVPAFSSICANRAGKKGKKKEKKKGKKELLSYRAGDQLAADYSISQKKKGRGGGERKGKSHRGHLPSFSSKDWGGLYVRYRRKKKREGGGAERWR